MSQDTIRPSKVILINPVYARVGTLGPFSDVISAQLPLSLGFLAGYLQARGVDAMILDEQLHPGSEQALAELLDDGQAAIVGITVLTLTAGRAYSLGAFIKERWPNATVVMGGVHVTLLPDEPLVKGVADIVVRGEGEVTFHELVERLWDGKPYDDVAGLSVLRNGKVTHHPERPLIENLDILPPFPYQLFEQDRQRYQFGNIVASRGCPYECIFCSQRAVSGRRYRAQSAQRTFADLRRLIEDYGQHFVFINDDNFLVNTALVRELCDLIIERKFSPGVQLGFNGRGDAMDALLLRRMREAGFAFILIGFETGSERLMKLIKKGETVEAIAEGVRIAKEAGFTVGGQFIQGFPTETRAESWLSIRHALRLPIDFVRFNLLVPYPGTEIARMIEQEQGPSNADWSNYATHGGLTGKKAPYVPKGRKHFEMVALQWIGHLLFYLRPRQLFNIHNIRYATAGQLQLPDPRSFQGCSALARFLIRLICFPFRVDRSKTGNSQN